MTPVQIETSDNKPNKLLKVYFIFVLLELFLLGSGQIIKYHFLTLRMLNFGLLNIICFILFRKEKMNNPYLTMVYVYVSSLILSSIIGFLNGASIASVFNDVKPLLFFIYLLPFSFLIKTDRDIKLVIKTIKISALILTEFYFLYLLIYQFNPFVIFVLTPFQANQEVFIRGNGPFLFYKGFFFIMISVTLISKETFSQRVVLLLLLAAVFLTLTRGLYVALIGSFIIMGLVQLSFDMRTTIKRVFLVVTIFILIFLFLPTVVSIIGDKTASDSVRFELINNVNQAITPFSFIFGHGFGVFAGVNRDHLEISYYEILHKQGIIGVILWFVPLIYCFNKLIKDRTVKLDKRFFIAVLSVYIISLTNPIINSPLGLSTIIISIIAMDIIHKENQLNIANN